MAAESIIYQRLAASSALTTLIGSRLYPSAPTENTTLPYAVYTVTGTEPQIHTLGASNLTRHDVQVETFAINLQTVLDILTAVRSSLHCWTADNVAGSFLNGRNTDEQDIGHHGVSTFSVWVRQ